MQNPMRRKAARARGNTGLAVAAGMLTLLSGCMVGPQYSKPSVPMAPAYSEEPPASYQESAGWKTAQPGDRAIRGNWWEMFGNAELNALEEQVAPANQSLKVAEANFERPVRRFASIAHSNTPPSTLVRVSRATAFRATLPLDCRDSNTAILPSPSGFPTTRICGAESGAP